MRDSQTYQIIITTVLAAALSACAGKSVRPVPAAGVAEVHGENTSKPNEYKQTNTTPQTAASAEYHFSMAQAYSTAGEVDRAIEEYKLALKYDTKSALIWARLATEFLKKGLLANGLEAAQKAVELDAAFVDARLLLAGLYSTARENKLAIQEYDTILKQDPKHEEAAVYKAQILLEEDRVAESVKFLRKFLKRVPNSALVWYYLARTEQYREKMKAAEQAYKKAYQIRPDFAQSALSLAQLYESTGRNKKALKIYKDLYESSENATAADRLATIYLKQEKYQEAIPYLVAIQNGDTSNLNARVKLGLVYMELKQYDQAIPQFKEILKINPKSERIHYYLGSLYEETQQFDNAISHLEKIGPDSQLFEDATLHITYLLRQTKREGRALAHIKDAIKKQPRIPSFYVFYSSIQEDKNEIKEAIAMLRQGVTLFPEHEKLRYYLGSLYDRKGEVDKSIEQMEAILAINPDNADALNYIGYTWTVQGVRLNDAEKLLRRALKVSPDNGYIVDSWGWYLFVMGRTDEAIVQLEAAVKLKPDESTILEHLGDAYAKSNLQYKALEQYQQAARFAKDDGFRKRVQGKIDEITSMIANGLPSREDRKRAPAKQ